jgi:hypothetical protein
MREWAYYVTTYNTTKLIVAFRNFANAPKNETCDTIVSLFLMNATLGFPSWGQNIIWWCLRIEFREWLCGYIYCCYTLKLVTFHLPSMWMSSLSTHSAVCTCSCERKISYWILVYVRFSCLKYVCRTSAVTLLPVDWLHGLNHIRITYSYMCINSARSSYVLLFRGCKCLPITPFILWDYFVNLGMTDFVYVPRVPVRLRGNRIKVSRDESVVPHQCAAHLFCI